MKQLQVTAIDRGSKAAGAAPAAGQAAMRGARAMWF